MNDELKIYLEYKKKYLKYKKKYILLKKSLIGGDIWQRGMRPPLVNKTNLPIQSIRPIKEKSQPQSHNLDAHSVRLNSCPS